MPTSIQKIITRVILLIYKSLDIINERILRRYAASEVTGFRLKTRFLVAFLLNDISKADVNLNKTGCEYSDLRLSWFVDIILSHSVP